MSLEIKVLTLFPEMVQKVLETSITGRAAKQGLVNYSVTDIRDYAVNKHRTVDDYPYGGGAGMIMMAPPIVDAVEDQRESLDAPILLMSPQGEKLDEELVLELLQHSETAGELILICGHYKGIDQRVVDILKPREISIGDFVLTGGELPALVIVDAIVRRIPGVLGDSDSAESDSFTESLQGKLECTWYTRPPEYRGHEVPEVLISGHHANIDKWREEESKERTQARRPDLLDSEDGKSQPK
jgi:tRNA (guanine37-N1)-methyltransferase